MFNNHNNPSSFLSDPGIPGNHLALAPTSTHQPKYQDESDEKLHAMIENFWMSQHNMLTVPNVDFKYHPLPLARVKKVMKADPDIKQMISSEAPFVFSKACEIFVAELTSRAWMIAEENKRRTLQRNDVLIALTKSEHYDFLIDVVPRDEHGATRRPRLNKDPTVVPFNPQGSMMAPANPDFNTNPSLGYYSTPQQQTWDPNLSYPYPLGNEPGASLGMQQHSGASAQYPGNNYPPKAQGTSSTAAAMQPNYPSSDPLFSPYQDQQQHHAYPGYSAGTPLQRPQMSGNYPSTPQHHPNANIANTSISSLNASILASPPLQPHQLVHHHQQPGNPSDPRVQPVNQSSGSTPLSNMIPPRHLNPQGVPFPTSPPTVPYSNSMGQSYPQYSSYPLQASPPSNIGSPMPALNPLQFQDQPPPPISLPSTLPYEFRGSSGNSGYLSALPNNIQNDPRPAQNDVGSPFQSVRANPNPPSRRTSHQYPSG